MPGNLPPGVIQLNNGGRAPGPPVPPVHPMAQPRGFPLAMPPTMPPTNPIAMAGGLHGPAPPPPIQVVPRDLRPGQPLGALYTKRERLHEEDAFELLISYSVILLEKTERLRDLDERGRPARSGWERVRTREQTGISTQEAASKVWFLGRDGKSVLEKKGKLSPVIQRQLERQRDKLNDAEPDRRFRHDLAQFEVHLREIAKDDKYIKASKKSRRPKFERASITAYFRRSPRPEHSARKILKEFEREQQRAQQMSQPPPVQLPPIQLPHPQHMQPQPQSQQPRAPPQMQAPVQPVVQPPVPPAAPMNAAPRGNSAAQNGPKPAVQGNQPKPTVQSTQPKPAKQDIDAKPAGKTSVQVKQEGQEKQGKQASPVPAKPLNNSKDQAKPAPIIIPNGKRGSKKYYGSPRSSRCSEFSDSSGSTIDDDLLLTPQTSIGSTSRRYRAYIRRPVTRRPRVRTQHFIVGPRHRDSDDERVYVLESSDDERLYMFEGSAGRSPSPRGRFRPNLEYSRKARPARPVYYAQSQDDYLFDKEGSRPRIMPHTTQNGVRHVDPKNPRRRVPGGDMERMGDHLERLRLEENVRLGRRVRWSDKPTSEFDGLEQEIQNRRLSRAYREEGYLGNEREGRWRMPSPRVHL